MYLGEDVNSVVNIRVDVYTPSCITSAHIHVRNQPIYAPLAT